MYLESIIKRELIFAGRVLTVEIGFLANTATESVVLEMGGTKLLVTLVLVKLDACNNFVPLRVDYSERSSSYGKIPGGYFKREGRLTDREILISRLIDRSLRPLIPLRLNYDIQINVIVFSIGDVDTDFLAIIGSSIVLSKSSIPLVRQPAVCVKVGYSKGSYFLNMGKHDIEDKELSIIISGVADSILMVDVVSSEISVDVIYNSISFGYSFFKDLILFINSFLYVFTIIKDVVYFPTYYDAIVTEMRQLYEDDMVLVHKEKSKAKHKSMLVNLINTITSKFLLKCENDSSLLMFIITDLMKDVLKNYVFITGKRLDGRDYDEIRPIHIHLDYLPNIEGSVVFTRGLTQTLISVTLGSNQDKQVLETPFGEEQSTFILHYNFPSFCVGEIGACSTSPKRREIGHGNIIRRSFMSIFPSFDFFPHVVRVISDITMSDGSSSMASICGASLALMCSGVPIKTAVSGISVGLITINSSSLFLLDLSGEEDQYSDFDFKISGTCNGITSIQMDTKGIGMRLTLFNAALCKGRRGYLTILDIMNLSIRESRELKIFTVRFKIDVNKIKNVIGKGGSVIKELIGNTKADIDIGQDGSVVIKSKDESLCLLLQKSIENIILGPCLDKIYKGVVTKIVDFGLFVSIIPGYIGLVHITSLKSFFVKSEEIYDLFMVKQILQVKVVGFDGSKIKLLLIST